MLGVIVGITRCTYENGATMVIPGSHTWDNERAPEVYEAVPAELEIGDALFFLGNTYHGGGANITQ
jgi:ectoine hydroxylase-related dioxygenase (phytanoyl-CoA dioxygenase family)